MSVGSFSVQTGQVQALSEQIRTGASGIREELDTLDSKVGQLRASWSGSAQEAYDVAQRKWTTQLVELQQVLGQIATATEQIAGGYGQQDKSSSGRFEV